MFPPIQEYNLFFWNTVSYACVDGSTVTKGTVLQTLIIHYDLHIHASQNINLQVLNIETEDHPTTEDSFWYFLPS